MFENIILPTIKNNVAILYWKVIARRAYCSQRLPKPMCVRPVRLLDCDSNRRPI